MTEPQEPPLLQTAALEVQEGLERTDTPTLPTGIKHPARDLSS